MWHAHIPGIPVAATRDIVFFLQLLSFSGGPSSTIGARHIRTGAPAWTRNFSGFSAIAAASGVLYVGYGTRTLQALTATTGRPIWTQQLATPPADIATGNDAVYVLDQNGTLYAYQI